MLIRLLLMLFSGESEHAKQSKISAMQRRKRTIDRLNKAKQNPPKKK